MKSRPSATASKFAVMVGMAGLVAASAGCSSMGGSRIRLAPAETAAESEPAGVRLVALGRDWSGPVRLPSTVTPVEVRVENRGEEPVRVASEHFSLRSTSREVSYSAVRPDRGAPTDASTLAWGDPVWLTGWVSLYRPLLVAASEGPQGSHPTMDATAWRAYVTASRGGRVQPWAGNFYGWRASAPERGRMRTYGKETPSLSAYALAPAVLEPGASATGWLFFEQVDQEEAKVLLTAELPAPDGDMVVASAQVPLEVVAK